MPRAVPAIFAALLALAGCGGGGGGDKGAGGQKKDAVTVGNDRPIAIDAREYSFEPKNVVVSTGTAKPAVVRFVLRNNGSLAHDLHMQKDGQDLGGTPIFGPGKTESAHATLAPGTYQFLCTVGDHADLGMKGTLTVASR